MMNKINWRVGDIVRCIEPSFSHELISGRIYTIKTKTSDIGTVQVVGSDLWWNSTRFEQTKEYRIKELLNKIDEGSV